MSATISVIMPARNAERFIRAAVESVVGQEVEGLELVVVDDGSTDGTARVAKEAGGERVRVVPGPGRGIAAAMNAGLAAARGEMMARCDADDLFTPGRLSRQRRWLAGQPGFVGICGGYGSMDVRGRLICELECGGPVEGEVTGELRKGGVRTHLGTYLMRTEGVRAIGGFREYFETSEDIDLQLRLGEYGRVWYDPKACYRYRLHDESITHAGPDVRRAFFEEVARGLQAQRLAGGRDDVEAGRAPLPPSNESAKAAGAGGQVSAMLIWRAWQELSAGKRSKALASGTRACLMRPMRLENWKNLALLAVKPAGKALRGRSCA